MAMEILTKDDLEKFKSELFNELGELLGNSQTPSEESGQIKKRWYKSHEVERLLKISTTKLQNMRIQGIMPYHKIGNTLFYDINDVNKAIEQSKVPNFHNVCR